eukprot:COSAG01_NODE_29669_length_632_cov_1.255159_1_plen_171_part_01
MRDQAEARRDPNWPDNLPRLLKLDMETTREPVLNIKKDPGVVGVRVFNMTPDDGMVWYTVEEMELNGGQPCNIKRVRGLDRVRFPYGLPRIEPGVHSVPGAVIIIEVAGFQMQHTLSDCESQSLFVNLVEGVPMSETEKKKLQREGLAKYIPVMQAKHWELEQVKDEGRFF